MASNVIAESALWNVRLYLLFLICMNISINEMTLYVTMQKLSIKFDAVLTFIHVILS